MYRPALSLANCARHCRCCSMSSTDLISSPATFDDDDEDEQHWRYPDEDGKSDCMAPRRRPASIVSTLSTPDILLLTSEQAPMATRGASRLRERIAASVAGLKELDVLREKHRRMVEEVKARLKLACADATGRPQEGYTSARSPSPTELSSNMSHRSSLSMDSGVCLSLASDLPSSNGHRSYLPQQRRLSTDSFSGYRYNYQSPSRKTSWTNGAGTSDEETGRYGSLACITTADPAVAPSRSTQAYRYRRRMEAAMAESTGPTPRPKSLYGLYTTEEDTGTIGTTRGAPSRRAGGHYRPQVPTIVANLPSCRGSAVDPVFRASRVFIDTVPEVCVRPRIYETRRPRPTSMAVPPSVSTPSLLLSRHPSSSPPPTPIHTKPTETCTRSSSVSTLVRQHSEVSVDQGRTNVSVVTTGDSGSGSEDGSNHHSISRSISSQSSDSTKSRRNREKTWHESGHL